MTRQILIDCRGNKSRKVVAEDLGITPQMLGMLERGDRNPSWNLAQKIAVYYELSVEQIFLPEAETKRVKPNKTA